MTAPREGCPSWCTSHYRTVYSEGLTVEGHEIIRWVEDPSSSSRRIGVQVVQSVDALGGPVLYVQGHGGFPLSQANAVADLLRALGHGDEAAAAVEELAALVTGGAR